MYLEENYAKFYMPNSQFYLTQAVRLWDMSSLGDTMELVY